MAKCLHCQVNEAIGLYCAVCYGAVLDPEGKPLMPGDPNDPWREFNAEADAAILDARMPLPEHIGAAIEMAAARRHQRSFAERPTKARAAAEKPAAALPPLAQWKRCPFCGCEEYYVRYQYSGKGRYARRFDGGEAFDNAGMYDELVMKPGRVAYCNGCDKPIAAYAGEHEDRHKFEPKAD